MTNDPLVVLTEIYQYRKLAKSPDVTLSRMCYTSRPYCSVRFRLSHRANKPAAVCREFPLKRSNRRPRVATKSGMPTLILIDGHQHQRHRCLPRAAIHMGVGPIQCLCGCSLQQLSMPLPVSLWHVAERARAWVKTYSMNVDEP